MPSLKEYLNKYDIVINTISTITVLLEFFIYRAVRFAASHATLLLFIATILTLTSYFFYRKYGRKLFHTIYSLLLAISIATLSICIYDRYIKHHHKEDIETALLTKATYRHYNMFLEDMQKQGIAVSEDVTACIFFREGRTDIKEFIKQDHLLRTPDKVTYFNSNNQKVNLYACEMNIIKAEALKDKKNHFLPSSTHDLFLGIQAFNKFQFASSAGHFKKASEEGNAVADYYLYHIYKYGYGCTPDNELAYKHLRNSAIHGSIDAKYELACHHLDKDAPSLWDIDFAASNLTEILNFAPRSQIYSAEYFIPMLDAFLKLMKLYDVIGRPRDAYRMSKLVYNKVSESYTVPPVILIEYAVKCYNMGKKKKVRDLLSEGRELDYDSAYYLSALLLMEDNQNRKHDREIEQYLLHAARYLEHQQSRELLSQFYTERNDSTRAELWERLYEINYSNKID